MKLRVAHVDNENRMAGTFVVQRRYWGSWWDMYFNPSTKILVTTVEWGEARVVKAEFDDFHEAIRYARAFRGRKKRIIREVWRI
jgi:hypothetical protein